MRICVNNVVKGYALERGTSRPSANSPGPNGQPFGLERLREASGAVMASHKAELLLHVLKLTTELDAMMVARNPVCQS